MRSIKSLCFLLSFVLLTSLGCGSSRLPEGETGTVAGHLTSQGQAIPEGTAVILLHKEKGLVASGAVNSSGEFNIKMRGEAEILVGPYFVGVSPPTIPMTPEQEAASMTGTAVPEPEWPAIPKIYRNPESSGISFDVKVGKNTLDLEMKK